MKALVIGGSRYFGKRLVSLMLEKNVEVTLLNRGATRDGFGGRVDRIHMDRKSLSRRHPLLGDRQWDVVCDQVCYDAADARGACDAFGDKTKKFIFTSTQAVYKTGKALTEKDFDPYNYKYGAAASRETDYGEAKRQAESVFFRTAPFDVTAVRFPIVLGEDDYTGRLEFHVGHIMEGQAIYFPDPAAKISFIHAGDAARFLEFLAERNVKGPVNCCSREPISLMELIRMIEKITGKKANLSNDPRHGDRSPFGIESDWYMDTRRMAETGFEPSPIDKWLPPLIETLVSRH